MNLKFNFGSVKNKLSSYKKSLNANPKKKRLYIIGFILVVLAILAYAKLNIFVVAIVNGKPITRIQLIKELEKQGGKQVLESIVTQSLIFQEAKKNNINVTEDDINKEIENIENQLKEQGTDLDTALSFQGQTRKDLSESLKLKIIIEKLISDKVNVTEEEIKKYFDENKSTFEANTKLDDVKEQIINLLKQQKLTDTYQKWLTETKSKSNIKYLLNF